MGQPVDERGNVLGEAFGATKREVFDTLMANHEDAAEIRIKSLLASRQMPRYRCHKEVWALKLRGVGPVDGSGKAWLFPEDREYSEFAVSSEYLRKHDPQPGGYFVVYDDGYESFSPAAPFEAGYTRI